MKRRLALACVAFLLLMTLCWSAEDLVWSRKHSEQAQKTADAYRQKIRAEIKALKGHSWAGEYYEGDGLGENVSLILAPKTGFVFEWHGCMGLYDRNYGTVTETNGRIRLGFTFSNDQEGFQGIAPELIPVAWGKRMYLIPPDKMIEFCNDVNDGSEPRKHPHGLSLLRCGDEKLPVKGFPDVPPEFKRYLLKQPIQAKIIGVNKPVTRQGKNDWKFVEIPVVVDRGEKQGLLKGMRLHVVDPGVLIGSVDVSKAEENRAEGVVTCFGEFDREPRVGWKLSTRLPWHP